MKNCYEYKTSIGPFYIAEYQGRYHAVFAGESLGSCTGADQIAAVLGYGYKFNFLCAELDELDTSNLGISPDLSDWKRLPSVRQVPENLGTLSAA
jgi:hypothetical protein